MTRITVCACHFAPFGVEMPRAVNCAAICRADMPVLFQFCEQGCKLACSLDCPRTVRRCQSVGGIATEPEPSKGRLKRLYRQAELLLPRERELKIFNRDDRHDEKN
jgi:hypothetical protein